MSTTGRSTDVGAAGALAGAVREAEFVSLVAAADGDALAAAGLLARGCRAAGIPFRASVARTDAERERRLDRDDAALAVAVGADDAVADQSLVGRDPPASATAHDVATDLGADADPVLALAGAVDAGIEPGAGGTADLLEAAREAGLVQRRHGVALPVADVADGLAHQTLVHADFAGDEAAATALAADAGLDEDGGAADEEAERRRLASLVALAAAGDERATARTTDAVERALRPYATPDGPFETVGGHADVLAATARSAPGIGIALALDGGAREAALSAWREHGRAVHAAVRSASTARYAGLYVARLEEPAPVERVARLVRSARSPEPTVLVVDDETAAAVAGQDLDAGARLREAVAATGGAAAGTDARAFARYEGETDAFVDAFRGADR